MSTPEEVGRASANLYHVESSDPDSVLVDRSHLSPADVAQVNRMMMALSSLRQAEDRLAEASARYMKLNRTDMRALHFVMVSENREELATPGAIAAHLGISTASTTKLLDRLAAGGHISREPHPFDRRALVIRVAPETHRSAMGTVGRQQAKRFGAAADLTPSQREVVIGFLEDMTRRITLTDDAWPAEDA